MGYSLLVHRCCCHFAGHTSIISRADKLKYPNVSPNKKGAHRLPFDTFNFLMLLVFFRQFIQFGQRKHRAVFTNIFTSDIAASTFADTALHAHF